MLINVLRPQSSRSEAIRLWPLIIVLALIGGTLWAALLIMPLDTVAVEFAGTTGLDVADLTNQSKNLQIERFDTQ
jgi:hypothetical protein